MKVTKGNENYEIIIFNSAIMISGAIANEFRIILIDIYNVFRQLFEF